MKSSMFFLAASLFFIQAKASILGSVDIAGNSCERPVGSYELNETRQGRFAVPVSLYVKKDGDKRVARGVCTFAMNLKASTGKKIVVSNSYQLVSLRAYPSQTKARIESEIFKAGSQGVRQSLEVDGSSQISKVNKGIEQSGVVVETECGGSAILRGNLAATLTGTGKARAFARDLYLDIAEVDCAQ